MKETILHGNIISADEYGKITIYQSGYLVAKEGKIAFIGKTLPEEYHDYPIDDYGEALIMQSLADMHLHAPQYPMLGMGMDLPLLEWLNTYTFPTESHFKNNDFARLTYQKFARELVRNGTTKVCMFSSLHREATLILMEELERAGLTGYVGKVNMDRNGSPDLQETTQESIDETIQWIKECHFRHIKPIITPRFTPSCTNKLMQALGQIAHEYNLPIQSHLSENLSELAWVKELHPDCEQYWQTYQKYGLFNSRTLMAHCVWSDERERKALKDSGVWVVHCASSNENLISGYAPVHKMKEEGLKVVLGSDIAGGDHLSMFDNIAATIRASKARRILDQWKTDFLTVLEAFYLATSAPNEFFNEKPGFAIGNKLHALVIDDHELVTAKKMTIKERFERCIYRRQKEAIKAVYSEGKKIFERKK
ncbi:MAG: amidohydrolase family protein [Bacilli bacterium]